MLSAYELDRLKNIKRNEDQLAALGLATYQLIPNKPQKTSKSKPVIEQSFGPARTSSRLAGKEVPSYAESARYLDEIDPDDDMPRRKKQCVRPTRAPDRYSNDAYEMLPRTRGDRFDPAKQYAELVSRLPMQPARMPSIDKILELRRACVTEEQLEAANYPEPTKDAYRELLIKQPFTYGESICQYDLMPFHNYPPNHTGKFKVQCKYCKEYYCLNKNTGNIHEHSRCQIIADRKNAELAAAAAMPVPMPAVFTSDELDELFGSDL